MDWKYTLKIVFILGLILVLWLIVERWLGDDLRPEIATTTIKGANQQRLRVHSKHVRFRPTVNVVPAGGSKSDRYNPALRPGVARNSSLAARVGGGRRLAQLSLLEAASSTSSEES